MGTAGDCNRSSNNNNNKARSHSNCKYEKKIKEEQKMLSKKLGYIRCLNSLNR